jgi:hypothetical protein
VLNAWEVFRNSLQELAHSRAILNVGRVRSGAQQEALAVQKDVALAAVDVLGAIVAADAANSSRSDRLAVDDADARQLERIRATYSWNFGDNQKNPTKDGQQPVVTKPGPEGLGVPYQAPNWSSPIMHLFNVSSYQLEAEGGFPIGWFPDHADGYLSGRLGGWRGCRRFKPPYAFAKVAGLATQSRRPDGVARSSAAAGHPGASPSRG